MRSRMRIGRIFGLGLLTLVMMMNIAYAQLCEIRVMPLGDSITRGVGSTPTEALNGYRDELYTALVSDGASVANTYTVDFVGGETDGSGFDTDHEGHGGWSASQVADEVYSWLAANPAEVVLLHIGTNSLTTDTSETERVLDEIDRANPATRVILAKIVDRATTSSVVTTYNNNLQTMADARIANGDLISVVDMQSALIYPDDMVYAYDTSDNLHPQDSGYVKMSGVWFPTLSPMLQDLCGAPTIFSQPVTTIEVTGSYSYDVHAVGAPTLSYQLLESPAGMSIDGDGLISWSPSAVGSFPVEVEVSNGQGSATQSFTLEVTDDIIIDNNDPEATPNGTWLVSGATGHYDTDSVYSSTSGDTFSFISGLADQREVFLWWTDYSNRDTTVTVEIYDGGAMLASLVVDQTTDGGQWNSLGTYSFTTNAQVLIRSDGGGSTSADAVRFTSVGESAPVIVSSAETSATVGVAYSYDVNASGYPAPTYTLSTSPAGMSIDSGSGVISWSPDSTGTFDVTVVASNGVSPADSQSFSIVVADAGSELILDNTDSANTTTTGSWSASGASGFYGVDSVYSKTQGDTFEFFLSLSGSHEVYLWWTEFSNRSNQVPVTIMDGSTVLDTVVVNQQADGGQWNLLGIYEFSGDASVVITVPAGNDSTVADAVRFVSAGASPPSITSVAPTSAVEGENYSYDVESLGSTPLTFSLTTAPSGMSIDSGSGLISWVAGAAGDYPVEVEASNGEGSDTQSFTITVSEASSDVAPSFDSTPVTTATEGQAYSYDANATGSPAPSYALDQGPSGMSVDSGSGLVSWASPVVGSYTVIISASNGVNPDDSQSFTLTVNADESGEPGIIIDNDDPGTSAEGSWLVSGAAGQYGSESLYSKNSSTDKYIYEYYLAGSIQVYLWWTEFSNRSSSVEVRLYDGTQLLDTMTVDQKTDGGQWNLFQGSSGPTYTFYDQVRVEILASGGGDTTSADAVKLVPMDSGMPLITSSPSTTASVGELYQYQVTAQGDPTLNFSLTQAPAGMNIGASSGEILWTPGAVGSYTVTVQVANDSGADNQTFTVQVNDPTQAVILDNGDTGTTASGSWKVSGASGAYGSNSVYSKNLGDSYTYEVSLNGEYEVQLWWTEFSNRADQVPVDIHHLDGANQPTVTTVYVDQRSAGGQWNSLGTYTFGGVAKVVVNAVGGNSVAADAVQFLP